jgi:hypothetical protein
MQNTQDIDRDRLLLVLGALALGLLLGLILAPKGRKRVENNSSAGNQNRAGANFVFGNIIVGSNNGRRNSMALGYDDSGDNE